MTSSLFRLVLPESHMNGDVEVRSVRFQSQRRSPGVFREVSATKQTSPSPRIPQPMMATIFCTGTTVVAVPAVLATSVTVVIRMMMAATGTFCRR